MKPGLLAVLLVGCGGCHHGGYPQPSPMPTVAEVVARLADARAALTSFTGESVMDYWLGDQRVKGTVLVMGATGAKVRFNALSPAGGNVLADMACDGAAFAYVDQQHNCQLTGPCTGRSIASLLHVELEPDDFIHLALGTLPVLEQPTGTVTWDAAKGFERIKLDGPAGTQTIAIDRRDGKWDVVASELKDTAGTVVWSVENTDWREHLSPAGTGYRLPGKTRFKSPRKNSDLLVAWSELTPNIELDPAKFVVQIPPGLPLCRITR